MATPPRGCGCGWPTGRCGRRTACSPCCRSLLEPGHGAAHRAAGARPGRRPRGAPPVRFRRRRPRAAARLGGRRRRPLGSRRRAPRHLALEGLDQGTWRVGLDRLLLGVAMEGGDTAWQGVAPVDDVDSGDVEPGRPAGRLVDRLDAASEPARRHAHRGRVGRGSRAGRHRAGAGAVERGLAAAAGAAGARRAGRCGR
nr:exodeoxyribonuclease V subunit gamma [Angustibacter aerolatus]